MGYRTVDEQDGEAFALAHRLAKAMWTRVRREFGIKDTYRVVLTACNPETLANLRAPVSHVLPQRDKPDMVILRVSKAEIVHSAFGTETLPREFANVVCKIKPELGDPYRCDDGWQKVVKKLGGSIDMQFALG